MLYAEDLIGATTEGCVLNIVACPRENEKRSQRKVTVTCRDEASAGEVPQRRRHTTHCFPPDLLSHCDTHGPDLIVWSSQLQLQVQRLAGNPGRAPLRVFVCPTSGHYRGPHVFSTIVAPLLDAAGLAYISEETTGGLATLWLYPQTTAAAGYTAFPGVLYSALQADIVWWWQVMAT